MKKLLLMSLLCAMQSITCMVDNLTNLRGKLEKLKTNLPKGTTAKSDDKPLEFSSDLKKMARGLQLSASYFNSNPGGINDKDLQKELDKLVAQFAPVAQSVPNFMRNLEAFLTFLGTNKSQALSTRPSQFNVLLAFELMDKVKIQTLVTSIGDVNFQNTTNKSLAAGDKAVAYAYLKKIDDFLELLVQFLYKFKEQNKTAMENVSWQDEIPPAAKGMAPALHWFEQKVLIPLNQQIQSNKILTGNRCSSGSLRCDILTRALRAFAPGTAGAGGGLFGDEENLKFSSDAFKLTEEANKLAQEQVVIDSDELKRLFTEITGVFNSMLGQVPLFITSLVAFSAAIKDKKGDIGEMPEGFGAFQNISFLNENNIGRLRVNTSKLMNYGIKNSNTISQKDKTVIHDYLSSMSEFLGNLYYLVKNFSNDNGYAMGEVSFKGPDGLDSAWSYFKKIIEDWIDILARPRFNKQNADQFQACVRGSAVNCISIYSAIQAFKVTS